MTIEIKVSVPFPGCKECMLLDVDRVNFYTWGEPYIEYICTHFTECENARQIAEKEE